MDYRDQVFICVAENLSFSKAAEELFISQPAISKHIKELESKLNILLFERKGNRIYLTKAGKLTYNSFKKIEQEYRNLEFKIGSLNNTFSGVLKIGASSTIAQYIVPKVMASFHKRYPKIELFLVNGNSFEMEQSLLRNEIDLALVENESTQNDLNYINFLNDELVAVTGANSVYAKRKNISLADFQEIPIVLRETGSGSLEVLKKNLARNGVETASLNTLIHLGSTEAIKNFLQDFDGIGIVSDKAISSEVYYNQLIKLTIKGLTLDRKFRIALRQGQKSNAANLFSNHLLAYNF